MCICIYIDMNRYKKSIYIKEKIEKEREYRVIS